MNENGFLSFIYADKMLCGVSLSQLKLNGKIRNKTSGRGRSEASNHDVTSVDICTGSDVTEMQNRTTAANDAIQCCRDRMTSSPIDTQLPVTEGEAAKKLIFCWTRLILAKPVVSTHARHVIDIIAMTSPCHVTSMMSPLILSVQTFLYKGSYQ